MADAKMRIETAKVLLEKGNRAKTTAEAQLEMANSQVAETTAKLQELGVTPETAADALAKLDSEINSGLDKVEALIPKL